MANEPAVLDTFDAFLSYNSGDAEWVVELKDALENKGVKVWLDREQIRPGDRFVTVLEKALNSARSVILVVSPGSLRSSWVEDEYHRALTLSNENPNKLRLIAVLIGDAEPPGFLANRDWVDFRDASQFTKSLNELIFGITGHRQGPYGRAAAVDVQRRDSVRVGEESSIDEVGCLARAIKRTRVEARHLRLYRLLASLPGFGVAAVYATMASEVQTPFAAGVIVASPLVTGLVGWSATATSLAECGRKLEQFELLRDGLEACRARTIPGCNRLRENFWNMMQRQTRDAGASLT